MHLVKKKKERKRSNGSWVASHSLFGWSDHVFLGILESAKHGRMPLTMNRDTQTWRKPLKLLMLDVCVIESKVHRWYSCILQIL